MRSVNEVTLLGNLGRDAETKFTGSGVACTKFSVATARRWKDKQSGEWKEETDWHNVILWQSENLANYLTKGKPVYVKGRLQTRTYEKDGQKHYATEIVADNLILLGGDKQDRNEAPVSAPRSSRSAPTHRAPAYADDSRLGDGVDPLNGMGISDDDLPF